MKVFSSVFFIHAMGFCLLVTSLKAEPEKDVIDKWIKDFSSETFQVREKASEELWKLGSVAIPLLREAALLDDPEVVKRAKGVIEKVELRITVDTPEKILSVIATYRKALTKNKLELLNELREENAFYQLLKLYSMEDEATQKELVMAVNDVAVFAAQQAIANDDIELAIELLRMAPAKHNESMALACLYRSLGQLDQQLANLNPPQNLKSDEWKVYLLRAKGDLNAAIAQAGDMNQLQLTAALKVLQGDPVPWLELNQPSGIRNQRANEAYLQIALKRWRGEEVNEKDFGPLEKLLKSTSRLQRNQAMISLASLGKLDAIQNIQSKDNPIFSYIYHLSREETDKALEVMGIDPQKPDFKAWAKKEFDENKIGANSDKLIARLSLIAGFLESRGLYTELEEAYSPHFAELQKQDPEVFIEFISGFFDRDSVAPQFIIEQISKWAGEDKARWGEMFTVILGEDEVVMAWLEWIRDIDPKMKDCEALEAMLAIFQRIKNPGDTREIWMNRLWREVSKEKNKELKTKYVLQIMSLCITQQDVLNTLKAWDMLDKEDRAKAKWGSIDIYLSAVGRWEEAAENLLMMREGKIQALPEIHAHLAVTLRHGGMEKLARVHEDMADKLSLGSALSSMRIAGYYVFAGDFEKADIWVKRAAMESDPADGDFLTALEQCAMNHVRSRNWKLAASCHEAITHIKASQYYQDGGLSVLAKGRMHADLARAMTILPENKQEALKILKAIHQDFMADGVLADDFFPVLREVGLHQELNEWFAETWNLMVGVIEKFPKSHNSRNTLAWFSSRAGIKLKEAEKYLAEAIKLSPEQAAYLDTMAELKFAQGDRKAALEWSQRSVCFAPFDDMIRFQHERFKAAPLPKN